MGAGICRAVLSLYVPMGHRSPELTTAGVRKNLTVSTTRVPDAGDVCVV